MDNHGLPEEVEGLDPIIVGLLQRLPKAGTIWSKDKRKIWLGLLEGSFDLIYGDSSAPKRFWMSRDRRKKCYTRPPFQEPRGGFKWITTTYPKNTKLYHQMNGGMSRSLTGLFSKRRAANSASSLRLQHVQQRFSRSLER